MQNRKQRALADELAELPSLRSCGKDDIRALAEAGSVVTLPDGWAFVQEGTPADAAYVLLDGEAKVLAGREEIATLSPGAILGEMAYIEGGQRKATVASSRTGARPAPGLRQARRDPREAARPQTDAA